MFQYLVTGRLEKSPQTSDDDIVVTLTLDAKNVRDAIKRAHDEEPEIKLMNIVRTLIVPKDAKNA